MSACQCIISGHVLLLAGEYDLQDVRAAVAVLAGKWKDLGLSLGLHPGDLDGIQSANTDSSSDFLRKMLSLWLKQSYYVSIFLLHALTYHVPVLFPC